MNESLLYLTIKISILIQVITGVLAGTGLFINIDKKHKILKDTLFAEFSVQIIELLWYLVIAFNLYTINNNRITSMRYIDWVITTPIMLIITLVYFEYNNNEKKTLDILKKNKNEIIKIVIYNFLMLLFGFLGEVDVLNKQISIPLGFVFFFLSFKILYSFVKKNYKNKVLFSLLTIIWSGYGIAAMFFCYSKKYFL